MKRSILFTCFMTVLVNAEIVTVDVTNSLITGLSHAFGTYMLLVISLIGVTFSFYKIKRFLVSIILGRSSSISPSSIVVTTKYDGNKVKKHGKNRVVI